MSMFGGNTGVTYEQLQRRRKIAERLMAGNRSAPRNVGEGLHAIGQAIAGRAIERRADKREAEMRKDFEAKFEGVAPNVSGLMDLATSPFATSAHKSVIDALMKGAPNFRDGGRMKKSGLAVVGEAGPEVVQLPKGAQVTPWQTPLAPVLAQSEMQPERYFQGADMQFFQSLSPDAQSWAMEGAMDGVEPSKLRELYERGVYQPIDEYDPESQQRLRDNPEDMAPAPMDMRELIGGAGGADGLGGGAGSDYLGGPDVEVIEKRAANDSEALKIKHALMSLFESLDDYETIYGEGGGAVLPGTQRDKLTTQRRAIQMQMKDLYNLGALQGPDLALLESLMVDPTAVGANFVDFLGLADLDDRFGKNTAQIREIMLDLAAPRLREYGISVDQIKDLRREGQDELDPSSLSDEDLIKMLSGG